MYQKKYFEPCDKKCKSCSEYDKCLSCNNELGYYETVNNTNNYVECYYKDNKNTEEIYLEKNISKNESCYESCEICEKAGNDITHNCLKCKSEYPFIFQNNDMYLNCYKFCHDNYYDELNNVYQCLEKPICIGNANKLIKDKNNTCIDDCSNDKEYIYEFKNICYKECPINESEISKDNKYICELKCPPEKPYENLINHQCIQNCNVNDIFNNKCKLNYKSNNKKYNISKEIIENIKNGNMKEILLQMSTSNESLVMQEGETIHLYQL